MTQTNNNTVVAISADTMGAGNDELGKVLIKSFIYVVSQMEQLPQAIVFYNAGAKLPVEGSECLEDLKAMEDAGVEILTCGTCLSFFDLKEKLAVGQVSNMYAIVDKLNGASKVLRP